MVATTEIKSDLGELKNLLKQLGTDNYARVGILGAKAGEKHKEAEGHGKTRKSSKTESPFTNAEIGIVQEFGSLSRGIPARSFLRMPIEEKKKELVRFMGTPLVKRLITQGEYKKVFKLLGIKAEEIVQEAFATRGFGKWLPLSQRTIDAKGSDAPLIDTGQLRRAITSDVVGR